MLVSIRLIILLGLLLGWLFSKIHLPKIIGMLVVIIIIAKAGLSLNVSDLKRIGRPAVTWY